MTSLFNSEPESGADVPVRSEPAGTNAAAAAARNEPDEQDEQMLFSAVRRTGGSGGSASSGAGGGGGDKEITLGTMTVLGIFFALAVLCAGFFAFGYSTGTKHTGKAGSGATITDASGVPGCKPSSGNLAGAELPPGSSVAQVNVPYTQPAAGSAGTKPAATVTPGPMAETPATVAALPVAAPVVIEHAAARTSAAALPITAPVAAPAGEQPTMVQVAALSHEADAELVASTLKGRGYNVAIHTSGTDKLLHVQMGPYATRKEADAMRQKLLLDGFNAILK